MVVENVIFKGHQMNIMLLLSNKNLTLHLNYLYPRILSAILVKIDPGIGVKTRKT